MSHSVQSYSTEASRLVLNRNGLVSFEVYGYAPQSSSPALSEDQFSSFAVDFAFQKSFGSASANFAFQRSFG